MSITIKYKYRIQGYRKTGELAGFDIGEWFDLPFIADDREKIEALLMKIEKNSFGENVTSVRLIEILEEINIK